MVKLDDIILELSKFIKESARKNLPGVFESLDILSRTMYGVDIVNLFFIKPSAFIEVISKHYSNEIAVNMIITNVFMEPLVKLMDGKCSEDELFESFNNGDERFFEVLRRCINFVRLNKPGISIIDQRKRLAYSIHV